MTKGPKHSSRRLADEAHDQCGLLPSRDSKSEQSEHSTWDSTVLRRMRDWPLAAGEYLKTLQRQKLRKRDPAVRLAHRYLAERFEELLVEAPRAWEGLDPEGVHQMRVATRRIRAAFRACKHVLPAAAIKKFKPEFKWVAAVLGDVRDLDVHQDNLRGYCELLEEDSGCLVAYQTHLAAQWRIARRELQTCLSSQRLLQLKDGFTEFLQSGLAQSFPPDETLSVGDAARQFIGRQYKNVLRDGRAISPDSPDEALHALRIDCKRLRYLFEFFNPVYGKALKPFIRDLKKLQRVLGEFHDACVATQQLRQYAERVPINSRNRGELIALGQIIGTLRGQAIAKRVGFCRVWKDFDRRNRRKKMLATLK